MAKRIFSGIYQIRNLVNNKVYIGQSINLNTRKRIHFYKLRKNSHVNKHLQNAWNKYREENFIFETLLICEKEELTYYEQKYVDILNPEYNIRKECVDSNKGIFWTEEMKENMSNLQKGKFVSNETRKKISESKKGSNISEETKKKISMFMASEKNPNIGRKHTEEAKRKMSVAKKGKHTGKEHHMYGKHWSEEIKHKNALSNSGENSHMLGKHISEEVKTKMSIGTVGRKKGLGSSSEYVGVSFIPTTSRWRARITQKRKTILIGVFSTEIEAAIAYNEMAIKLYGENAKLNIIEQEVDVDGIQILSSGDSDFADLC